MLSKPLLKKTLKNNYKLWIAITAIMTLMLIMMLAAANSFAERAAGGGRGGNGAGGAGGGGMSVGIIENFYGMMAMLLPMIYIVITGNKLIAAQVDKGCFAYVMSKPLKRNQVSVSQAVFFIGSVIAMFAVVTLAGMAMIGATGLEIETGAFLLLNLGIVCFHLAISGISYMASCIFNRSGLSLLVGAGIPIVFYLFSMLASFSNLAEAMGLFKYFTINTLYNVTDIMSYSTSMIWQFMILFGIAVACYGTGIACFKRKDLPL